MKKIIFAAALLILTFSVANSQTGKSKNNPAGKWLFDAPTAPQGFTSGLIEIAFADNKYSAAMSFPGNENKLPGDKVKFENDSLSFSVFIEGQEVAVKIGFTEEMKMTGKAVYTDGEVALTLKREAKSEK